MLTNVDEEVAKSSNSYICKICDYITCKKFNYDKHLLTDRHKKLTIVDIKVAEVAKQHICDCGKEYKHRQSLSVHKKKCNILENAIVEKKEDPDYKELIMVLINENKEMRKTISELIPKVGNNNNNNNSNNNINIKIDNITLLNDKCRDAISITDFIESIAVNVKDLVFTSQKGLTSGVSNLFLEQLNNLPLVKRPIWCADKKRKKILIKEEEWREDKNQEKTKKAIKDLTVKQAKNINKYKNDNPDWMTNDKKKEKFISIVKEATNELDEEKQMNIINNLLDTIHLTSDYKEELQNPEITN
jgi:hypothetical protein